MADGAGGDGAPRQSAGKPDSPEGLPDTVKRTSAAPLVKESASADAPSASPLPSSLAGAPIWLYVLIGVAGALVAGGIARAIGRRER